MTPEGVIQAEILAALGTDPRIRIWRQNTGVGLSLDGSRMQRFGVKGGGDISGIIAGSGRRLEIEVKTETGRQSEKQRNFQAMITRYGGVYIVARSVEDARAQLERVCV